jgi:hypothetical protein
MTEQLAPPSEEAQSNVQWYQMTRARREENDYWENVNVSDAAKANLDSRGGGLRYDD